VLLVAASLPRLDYQPLVLLLTLAAYILLNLGAALRYRSGKRGDDVAAYRLALAACVVLACGWLAAL
jgi:hypothetical protein